MNAEQAIERVRDLHRPTTADVMGWRCLNGVCDHLDDCPEEQCQVCVECDGIRETAYDEASVITWPCATIKALDGTP